MYRRHDRVRAVEMVVEPEDLAVLDIGGRVGELGRGLPTHKEGPSAQKQGGPTAKNEGQSAQKVDQARSAGSIPPRRTELRIEAMQTRLPFSRTRQSAGRKSRSPDTSTATSKASGTVA